MKLQMIGCSHHHTDVAFREKLAFQPNQVVEALAKMRTAFPQSEAVLISTCNRVEIYTAAENEKDCPSAQQLINFVANYHGLAVDEIATDLRSLDGEDAIRHLFTMAASLDSMVIGEAQILSQVKQAYDMANQGENTGPLTHSSFQAAMRVAKRVQTETNIHRKRVSIPSVAVADYASQFFERFDDKVILVIGAGEIGEETLQYLIDKNARDIRIINRNHQRAVDLASRTTGEAYPWEQLDNLLVDADLIVSATGATEPIVTAEAFQAVAEKRYQRPLFILDLAVPRDIDPALSDFLGVYLYSIDDLQDVCDRNRKARKREWPKAESIIDEEVVRFMTDLYRRVTGPWIGRLKQQANEIKAAELERLLNKLGDAAQDPKVRKEIEVSLGRVVNKLLHPPLESLRDEVNPEEGPGLLDALKKLFQLKD
ncbi:MAG: glutamyl-tRNA reductase [Planctomycetaceae bacterium]|nr:glutamyl-tRNA reductase [Planctomycetaceae bacterium]|tara:strand:+ start:2967 stop:4247 length:1281 start_codon:yes stop_codon:yes gene_type:complete